MTKARNGLSLLFRIRSCTLVLLCFAPAPQANAVGKPIRALMVTGGCCHDYDTQQHLISEGISAISRLPVEWTVVNYKGPGQRIPLYGEANWAKPYDIVFHNECFADEKDPAWIERILKPHRGGVPAVVMHCSMHSYGFGRVEPWVQFLGVRSHRHGAHYSYRVEPMAAGHPILKELGASWQTPQGELYQVAEVMKTATPLARAKRQGGTEAYDVCFWVNQFEKARVFGTTVGHHNETVEDPVWLNTVARGFLWALGRLEEENLNALDHDALKDVMAKAERLAVTSKKESQEKVIKQGVKVPANLALGKPVTASSEQNGNAAKRGADGNLATRWCAAGSQPEEWWQVDLGEPKHVRGCRIHWERSGTRYRYLIESSANGKEWVTIVDRSRNEKRDSVGTHVVDAPGSRYLRVVFKGTDNGSWGSFWEFEAYAGEIPPVEVVLKDKVAVEDLTDKLRPPDGFEVRVFGKPPEVNYPVCIAAAPTGEVFVGVDENGSLGKGRLGKALRCVDTDGDGVADEFKVFATMFHPRGLFFDNGSLWVLHPPFLTVFRDLDGDGVSDESEVLVRGISSDEVKKRGADHTTNGIRVGVDGWIYIAVGDFGFVKAVDAGGREVQLLGGGIARVRLDGTELEIYARGLRNVCDVAVDPYLNLFTRDNTNDGGGWDIRVSHIVGSAHYGYPSLFKNFKDEHLPPLGVYGGGSGTGALFIDEPSMPEGFRRVLLTCDWGRSAFYYHPLESRGGGFAAGHETFMNMDRPTDMDVDGSGRLYLASWKNGQFSYQGPNVGYVAQLTAKGFEPKPFPNLNDASNEALLAYLAEGSQVLRLHAQREILRRGKTPVFFEGLMALASGEGLLASKVAAIFTLKQMLGAHATPALVKLAQHRDVREFALRALADRKSENSGVPLEPFLGALSDSPRVQVQALIGLGRLGRLEAAEAIIPLTASSDPVVAHVAVKALVELRAVDAALGAVGPSDRPEARGALQALKQLHEKAAVEGLISKLETLTDRGLRREVLSTLIRLYYREAEWKGGWWGTRPDSSGPYYGRATWAETPLIEATIQQALAGADESTAQFIQDQIMLHKVKTTSRLIASAKPAGPVVDVAKVLQTQASGSGQGIGSMSFDRAVEETLKRKGNAKLGAELFQRQGCIACHAVAPDEAPRGPMLRDITKRYSSRELLDSIIRPNNVIAQGFAAHTFELKDGEEQTGFVVSEGAEEVEVRTILGESVIVLKKEIESRTVVENSMMPEGLVSGLTPDELAALLAYLGTLKGD